MKRSGSAPAFVRPAILEAILLCTGAVVALVSIVAGERIACTALVEFGMLSAIAAASAGALFARYAVEICGILADYRSFEFWGLRASTAGYLVLGIYALVNAGLDLLVPRRDADWASFPGLSMAAVATLVTILVLQSKYRILEQLSSRSLFESISDDAVYLSLGFATLAALVAHVFAPAWWLDTTLDLIFVGVVTFKLRSLRNRRLLI